MDRSFGSRSGVVCAAIMPHGFSLIPQLSDDAEGGLRTREALREVGRRFAAAAPEVIVVATPHGFRVPGAVCVADAGRGAGTLSWRGRQVEQNVPLDRRFVAALARAAERHDLPLVLHGYAGEGAEAVVPLDWGAMVPLWFLGHGRNLPGSGHVLADPPERDEAPAVVVVSPSPSVPPESLVRFGRAIVEAAAEDGRRAAYVASCDWSHTHRADGPYGYHPQAAEVDTAVCTAVRSGRLADLAALDSAADDAAVVDGVPQALVLAGVVEESSLAGEVLTYEAPTYYGMLVAAYR
ncbi:MAG TPA: aromatic ring-opening dioxygenase subunit LigB [Thermomicrobiales bacterium]|nr:aromatic ring-opening dioxygenase subunit LigB [Thermomicrobiales bacterium]